MESGAINQVIGRVTIRVADFVGSIECDAAGYSVTFLELERQPNVLVANLTTGAEEGC